MGAILIIVISSNRILNKTETYKQHDPENHTNWKLTKQAITYCVLVF